jgi:hypothetical protein
MLSTNLGKSFSQSRMVVFMAGLSAGQTGCFSASAYNASGSSSGDLHEVSSRHPGFQCGPVCAGGAELPVEHHGRQLGGVHHLSDRPQRGCNRVLLQLGQRGDRVRRGVGVVGRPDGSGSSERVTEFLIGPEQRIGIRPSPHEQASLSPVGAAFQPRRSRLKASPTKMQTCRPIARRRMSWPDRRVDADKFP